MGATLRLGKVAGIEVRLHWSLAIVFAIIAWTLAAQFYPSVVPDQPSQSYWLAAVLATIIFYGSLLSHEMGHSLVARRLGLNVEGITLWIFGGVARLRGDSPSAGAEVRIVIAGPIVSIALALAFGAMTFALDVTNGPGLVEGACLWLAFSNGSLALFNLLPAFPLDGGRLLRAWLWSRSGDRYRATSTAAWWGRASAVLLIAGGLLSAVLQAEFNSLWLILVGVFLMSAARSEEAYVLRQGTFARLRVADVMSLDPILAPGWITVDEFLRTYVPLQPAEVYPLKTFEGELDGLVTATSLAQVPADQRRAARVRDIASGLDDVVRAAPGELLSALAGRLTRANDGQVLVMDGDRLVGILSPRDITRALGVPARR